MAWFDDFVKHAHREIPDEVVESLNARGMSDEQIELFSVGYVDKKLPPVECPPDFLKWCHHGGKLEDSYCFPLTNILNEVRGFQFRPVCREKRGYLDYIAQTGEAALFGLGPAAPHIWSTGAVFLVEGVFDLCPVQRFYSSTVALMSTHITDSMLRNMRRLCHTVLMGLDNDATGRRATGEFLRKHGAEFKVTDLGSKYPKDTMPSGKPVKDYGDLWELWGDKKLGEFLTRCCK
jgi:DNA primase